MQIDAACMVFDMTLYWHAMLYPSSNNQARMAGVRILSAYLIRIRRTPVVTVCPSTSV